MMLHVATTCPDPNCARAIARAALEQRLAACANIVPGVLSLFHWQGGVQEETEAQLVFKTTGTHGDALIELIRAVHPYDLPVITSEVVATTPDATEWLLAETR